MRVALILLICLAACAGEVEVSTTSSQVIEDDSCETRCGPNSIAPSGCGCGPDCYERGDCCSNAAAQCSDVPLEGSCRSFCGQRHFAWHDDIGTGNINDDLEPARRRDGCSCDADCGYYGICCPDVETHCEEIDFEPTPNDRSTNPVVNVLMDGTQFDQVVMPKMAFSLSGDRLNTKYLVVDDNYRTSSTVWHVPWGSANPGSPSRAGLSKVLMQQFTHWADDAMCSVAYHVPANQLLKPPYWTVAASSKNDSTGETGTDAQCEAMGWRHAEGGLGNRMGIASGPTGYGEKQTAYGPGAPALMSRECCSSTCASDWTCSANSFPLLATVRLHGLWNEFDIAGCNIYETQNQWWIDGTQTGINAGSTCEARLASIGGDVTRQSGCPADFAQVTNGNQFTDCVATGDNAGAIRAEAHGGGGNEIKTEVAMWPRENHACFLKHVEMSDVDEGPDDGGTDNVEAGVCEIYASKGRWWLRAKSRDDSDSICEALCVELHNSWPGAATFSPAANALGSRLELYQGGLAYDMPLVLLPGFEMRDPMRKVAPIVRMLQELGIDIWVVEYEEATQDIRQSAREAALAVDVAYHYSGWNTSHPGKKIAVAGASMGGLVGRVMLGSWENGSYNNVSSGEFIAAGLGDGTATPPVSLFVSANGPQRGAVIPLSFQSVVQDTIHAFHEAVGLTVESINSPGAANMLYQRIDARCKLLVDNCAEVMFWTTHSIFDSGYFGVWGSNCGVDTTGCIKWGIRDGEFYCDEYATMHDDFFATVNSRNGNGYPQTVATLAMSNGSWSPPSCANLTPGTKCTNQLPSVPFIVFPSFVMTDTGTLGPGEGSAALFASGDHVNRLGTIMGTAQFTADGFPFDGGFCSSHMRADARYSSALELKPGDVWKPVPEPEDMFIASQPLFVPEMKVTQHMPFTFIPTESALDCEGATDETACAAMNASAGRFTKVASSPVGKNGFHDKLQAQQIRQIWAFVADAFFGDADGYCGSLNPILTLMLGADCVGPPDCDDTNPNWTTNCGSPVPSSPAKMASVFSCTTLIWNSVPNAIGYEFEVVKLPENTVVDSGVTGGVARSLSGLVTGSYYRWRVRGKLSATVFTPWSTPWTFRVTRGCGGGGSGS